MSSPGLQEETRVGGGGDDHREDGQPVRLVVGGRVWMMDDGRVGIS